MTGFTKIYTYSHSHLVQAAIRIDDKVADDCIVSPCSKHALIEIV